MAEAPFMTVDEVGALLNLTPARVYQLARAGLIPTVRLTPGRIRVPRAAFDRWLEQQNAKALAHVAS